jgi:hypothetical protein
MGVVGVGVEAISAARGRFSRVDITDGATGDGATGRETENGTGRDLVL